MLSQNPEADYKALIASIKTAQVQTQDEAIANPAPEDDGLASFKL